MNNKELMQKISELENIITQSKQKIEELKIEIKNHKKEKEGWKPDIDERYYFIDECGCIDDHIFADDDIDNGLINNKNCFKTPKEAEEETLAERLYRELKQFANNNNKDNIRWNDEDQWKYSIVLNHDIKQISVFSTIDCQTQNVVYFTERETALEAIELFKDDLEKYYNIKQRDKNNE